jgi:hypothetical protein
MRYFFEVHYFSESVVRELLFENIKNFTAGLIIGFMVVDVIW